MSNLSVLLSLTALLLGFVYADDCADGLYSGDCCVPGAVPLSLNISQCAPGFYCPHTSPSNSSTWPSICPPTTQCEVDRLGFQYCAPQGRYEPEVCSEGYYCPTPQEELECPENHFCPPGTSIPHKCGPMSSCPAGSARRSYWGSLVLVVIFDACLALVVTAYRRYKLYTFRKVVPSVLNDSQHAAEKAATETTSLMKGMDMHKHSLPKPTRRLVRGFRKAKGALSHMHFQFKSLSLSLTLRKGERRVLLNGVTGSLQPSKVTAIMGPSGAGKTTFLRVLMGKIDPKTHTGGEILINGCKAKMADFKKVVGYVPQDDVMIRELSVWENINYSARIRLPPHWSNRQVHTHVRAVVDAMGLAEVSETKIGDELTRGISGGQRKRVNIGMELAAAPLALFLDEPTSGLDATSAMDVCTLLHDIAQETGITVAMIIHQPRVDIWNSLDELLVLGPGGRTVYQGPQSLAQRYFEQHLAMEVKPNDNPADVLMDTIAENGVGCAKQWEATGRAYMHQLLKALGKANESDPEGVLPEGVLPDAVSLPSATAQSSGDVQKAVAADLVTVPLSPIAEASSPSGDEKQTPVAITIEMPGSQSQPNQIEDEDYVVTPTPGQAGRPERKRGSISLTPTSTTANKIPADEAIKQEQRGGSFLYQFLLCHIRSVKQQHEKLNALFLECGVAMFAGFLMGVGGGGYFQGVLNEPYVLISAAPLEFSMPQLCMFVNMAIGLSASAAGVRAFGEEKSIYFREAASGHSRVAYFLGVNTAMLYRIGLTSLHFAFVFHLLASPLTDFGHFYLMVFLSFYAVYGLAAVISMVVKRENAPLLAVVFSLFAAVFDGYVTGLPEFLKKSSYAWWAAEGLYDQEVTPFRHLYQVDAISAPIWGYKMDQFGFDMSVILMIGTAYRVAAFILMVALNRSKQR